MELLQLKYFFVTANTESVTKAAEILHISQPSLSQTIRRLEHELQATLFEHNGKKMRLTYFGKEFYRHVENILKELDLACSTNDAASLCGDIVIGTYLPIHPLLPYIKEFSEQNPDVTFTILSITEYDRQFKDNFDVLLMYEHSNNLNFREKNYLGTTETTRLIPASFPQYDQDRFNPKRIQDMPLIVYIRADGTPSENILSEISQNINSLNIKFRTNSSQIKEAIIEEGLAGGFNNSLISSKYRDTGNYRIAPHTNITHLDYYVCWKNDQIMSPTAFAFKKYLQEKLGIHRDDSL